MSEKIPVHLVELQPYDSATESVVNVNFSDNLPDAAALGTVLPYHVRLTGSFSLETSVFEDNIPGGTTMGIGSISLMNADGGLDYLLDYSWDSRTVVVKRGFLGDSYALSFGPQLVTNGTGNSTVGWTESVPTGQSTLSSVSGKLRITRTGTAASWYQNLSTIEGRKYNLKATLLPHQGDRARIILRKTSGDLLYLYEEVGASIDVDFVADSSTRVIIEAARSDVWVDVGEYAEFDDISVTEINPYYETIFTGASMELVAGETTLTIVLRDASYRLTEPLQNNKYLGTGGKEGPIDLANRRKPLAYGRILNATPVQVNPASLLYQIHDGSVEAIPAVWDRGNTLTFGANHANYAALAAASITSGYYDTCLAEGYLRLGAKPAGTVTCDVDGEFYSTADNVAELASQVLELKAGLSNTLIDSASVTQFGVDHPFDFVGVYLPEPDNTIDELIETLMASANAFWFIDSDAKINFKVFNFTTPSLAIREEDVAVITREPSPRPLHTVVTNYAKNPTVQSLGDFSIPRETLNGWLDDEKIYVLTDGSGGGGTYSYQGEFEVYLNDTKVNDLTAVQFREVTDVPWLTLQTDGTFTISNPGVNSATAILEARLGEFAVTEEFTLEKRLSPLTNYLHLTNSNRRFFLSAAGVPEGAQTSVITATGSGLGTLTFQAEDNLGNVLTLTGSGNSRTLNVTALVNSPLVQWVRVFVTDSNGLSNSTKIVVQRGTDAYAAGVLGALAAANESVDIYYQNDPPVGAKTDDLWFDLNDNNKLYRWNGSSWALVADARIAQALTDAAGAQATADGKVTTFFATSAPTAIALGDLWFNPNTGVLRRWNGSNWNDEVGTRNTNRGEWTTGTAYVGGDFFTWLGNSYIVITAHTSSGTSPDFSKATLLSAVGLSTWTVSSANSTGFARTDTSFTSLPSYSGSWAARFSSVEAFKNAVVTARPSQTNKAMIIGLTKTPATAGQAGVKYGVEFKTDGTYGIVLNGAGGTPDITGSYTTSDVFILIHQADQITVTKSGTLVHTFTGVPINDQHNLDGVFGSPSAAMDSVTFSAGPDNTVRTETIYKRSPSAPATPTGNNPSGWSASIPDGNDALWSSTGLKLTTSGTLVGVWSAPALISGQISPVEYASATTYYQNQTVTYNGGTYILAVTSSTGNAPSGTTAANAYWNVIAGPGGTGAPATPPGAFSTTIGIAGGTGLVNLRTLADSAGYTGASDATVTYNVTGTRTGNPGGIAIDTGTWPSGSHTITLTLNVQASQEVRGGGGWGAGADGNGAAGADAIYCRENITINNSGAIRGGGGGGGGGHTVGPSGPQQSIKGGGGGGGGYPNGNGGPGEPGGYLDTEGLWEVAYSGSDGSAGTTSGGGAGGASGGGAATAGGSGGGAATAGSAASSGGSGGVAGYAVRKNGKTVNASNGTVSGSWA